MKSEHLAAIILFAAWGFGSYFILKFARKVLPPPAALSDAEPENRICSQYLPMKKAL